MEQASGGNARIVISGAETTRGVIPVTPAGLVMPFESESLGRKTELLKSNIIRSSRNASKPSRGKREASGNIKTELSPAMGRQLLMGYGSVVTAGAGPSYTHTFKIGQALPYHTIEKGFTDLGQYFQYLGCKCNKMGFEVNPSGILPLDMDFMGLDRLIETESFDPVAVDLGHDAWEAFEAAIKIGGQVIDTVSAVKWSLENNLDGDVYCIGGGGKRYSIPEGATVVAGSITVLFDSVALLEAATNGTENSLEFSLSRGTGDGTAGNEKLTQTFDELIFQEQDPIIKDKKGILLELPWTAYWNNGPNGTSAMAVLKNTQATL